MGGRDGDYGPEQRAEELYLDGMEKLEAGHREWAVRTFEDLIARFPETSAAGLAQRRLGELQPGGTVEPAALPAEPAAIEPAQPSVEDRAALWAGVLRRNAAIQNRLREQAGDRVFFASGSAELGTRARMALIAQAQWLKTWHEFEAAIEGHADEPGTDEENFRLSLQRAETVRQRLIDEGVDSARLAIVAVGRSEPLATCESPECRAQNRRVVTLVFTGGTHERLGLVPPAPPAAPDAADPARSLPVPSDSTDGTH
jgi:peptidoglycan-associated lipoprotein